MILAGVRKRSARGCGSRGFSLVELLVVVVIMGILAAVVSVSMHTGDTVLKRFMFNLKLQMRQYKAEAIKRGRDVCVDFDFDGNGAVDNGYTAWVDENRSGAYEAASDTVLKTVVFENKVAAAANNDGPEIYCNACGIVGGPGNDGAAGGNIGDGVTVAGDRFVFRPDGTVVNAGTIYIYMPLTKGGVKRVRYGPWAVIVDVVGRVRLDEYKSDGNWYRWKTGVPVKDN